MDLKTQAKIAQILRRADQQLAFEKAQAEASAWNDGRDTDRARGVGAHDPRNQGVSFDQHIYWLPPHFLELRKELHDHWHMTYWPRVGWYMANQAETFVEVMNEITGLQVHFDTAKVDWICEQFLKKLREMRGA